MCELSPAHARNRARARDLAVDYDCEQEHEWDQEIRCYCASYRIRPQFSQFTMSLPGLTWDGVGVVTFIWQPMHTPCSIAPTAASPLLLKRRSKRASKSSSIFPASSARSAVNCWSCDSKTFDFSSRSTLCRAID